MYKKMVFNDGYIEETENGLTCVGNTAVESGIIIRKLNISLEMYLKAFDLAVKDSVEKGIKICSIKK